jgi:hypothetical protein
MQITIDIITKQKPIIIKECIFRTTNNEGIVIKCNKFNLKNINILKDMGHQRFKI